MPSVTSLCKIHTKSLNSSISNSHHTHSSLYHVSWYCALVVCTSVFPNNIPITTNQKDQPESLWGPKRLSLSWGSCLLCQGDDPALLLVKALIFSFCFFIGKLEKRKCIVSGTSLLMYIAYRGTTGTLMQGSILMCNSEISNFKLPIWPFSFCFLPPALWTNCMCQIIITIVFYNLKKHMFVPTPNPCHCNDK